MGDRLLGCTSWRWKPSCWRSCEASKVLTFLLSKWLNVVKIVPFFSKTTATAETAWGPWGTAVHPSWAEGVTRGLCRSSASGWGEGDCKDSPSWPCWQSVLWLSLSGAVNANQCDPLCDLPTAKLHRACEEHGGKSLLVKSAFPLHTKPPVQASLALLPPPNFPLQQSGTVRESISICCAEERAMRAPVHPPTTAQLPHTAWCSWYRWSLKTHR